MLIMVYLYTIYININFILLFIKKLNIIQFWLIHVFCPFCVCVWCIVYYILTKEIKLVKKKPNGKFPNIFFIFLFVVHIFEQRAQSRFRKEFPDEYTTGNNLWFCCIFINYVLKIDIDEHHADCVYWERLI